MTDAEKRMNKEEAIKWLRDFINEVDSQDNRATAKPIQFLVQRKREYVAHNEYNHGAESVWRHPDMESTTAKTEEEAIEWLKEYGYEGNKLEEEIQNIEEFKMCHYWETDQAFFTKRGVQKHIELNGHNLRDYRDYVVHAFRNPEMRELFMAIREMIKE